MNLNGLVGLGSTVDGGAGGPTSSDGAGGAATTSSGGVGGAGAAGSSGGPGGAGAWGGSGGSGAMAGSGGAGNAGGNGDGCGGCGASGGSGGSGGGSSGGSGGSGGSSSGGSGGSGESPCDKLVEICHYPPGNPGNAHTLAVGASAVSAHVTHHGDTIGACGEPVSIDLPLCVEPIKAIVCHIPHQNPNKAHTIEIGAAALDAHLMHGDKEGPCP